MHTAREVKGGGLRSCRIKGLTKLWRGPAVRALARLRDEATTALTLLIM